MLRNFYNRNAEMNIRNECGDTPLHSADETGNAIFKCFGKRIVDLITKYKLPLPLN